AALFFISKEGNEMDNQNHIIRESDPHLNSEFEPSTVNEENNSEAPVSSKKTISGDGSISVENLSAFWIPEITIEKEIGGTVYTVTGSYEGGESFLRKLERHAARKVLKKDDETL
ncbi:MAG: hypothetical protein II713_03485, partial [Clostridia bacterium]|nr:hypothetical protein [Clostridia bacterium]